MSKVLVIYTGGTIGMVHVDDNPVNPLVPVQDAAQLEKSVPQLRDIEGVEFSIGRLLDEEGGVVEALDSSDINATHWRYMAGAVARDYHEYDGFVILHGTDTMAYTASALSFMLANLDKPVVITGSQLPIQDVRTDAVQNLANALYIAGYKSTELAAVPEVTICFADALLRGNRVRKMSSSAWQGFATPNYPRLGDIGEHIRIHADRVRQPSGEQFYSRPNLATGVVDFGLFPGFDVDALRSILALDQVRGMVLRTFGAGNAPGEAGAPGFLDVVKKAVDNGKVIVNVTQCAEGQVEAGLYEASSGLLDAGVMSGQDMTPEAALTKLMWLIGEEPDAEEVGMQVQIDQRGEQTESAFDVAYEPKGARPGGKDGKWSSVTVGARPAGQFHKAKLHRAVLRVKGLSVAGEQRVPVRVFLNDPQASPDKPENDPYAASGFLSGGNQVVVDVTSTVKRVVEDGRAINVTLVAERAAPLTFDRMSLSLFTRW